MLQSEIDAAVKQLLHLKATFKSSFGVEWGPNVASSLTPAADTISTAAATEEVSLSNQIISAQSSAHNRTNSSMSKS